jgi:radical SAM superfamily enzyme YgiQ (UPF0313 family)
MHKLIYNQVNSILKIDKKYKSTYTQLTTIIADCIKCIDEPTQRKLVNALLSSKYDSLISSLFSKPDDLSNNLIVTAYEFCNRMGPLFTPNIKKIPILLIQARVTNSTATHPPIGLAMLAGSILDLHYQSRLFAQLRIPPTTVWNFWKYEFDFQILDFQILSDDFAYEDLLESFAPKYVGFRTVSASIDQIYKLATITRKILCKDVTILFGGIHTTVLPDEIISKTKGAGDYLFIGEAEESFPHFMLANTTKEIPINNIDGIIKVESQIQSVKNRQLYMNLDDYPLYVNYLGLIKNFGAYDTIKEKNVWGEIIGTNGVGLLISSRGCKGACTFCSTPSLWRWKKGFIRIESGKSVIAKILAYYHLGYRVIYFRDDDFLCDRDRALSIVEQIENAILNGDLKKDFGWCCMARADHTDRELLVKMYHAGLSGIAFGVESGDHEVLKAMNKKLSICDVRSANDFCRQIGINFKNYFIVGFPNETWYSVLKTALVMIDLLVIIKSCDEAILNSDVQSETTLYNLEIDFLANKIVKKTKAIQDLLSHLIFHKHGCAGSVNVSYCVPYPGSILHSKHLNQDIFLESNNWQHGPLQWNNNLSSFNSPIRTNHMDREELSVARQQLLNIFEGCKKGNVELLNSSLLAIALKTKKSLFNMRRCIQSSTLKTSCHY